MFKGLSDKLKLYYPDITKTEKLKVNTPININKSWIAGFFTGEGCFSVSIYKSKSHKIGYGVLLQIIFSQHSRYEILFDNIQTRLECGNIKKYKSKNIVIFPNLRTFIIRWFLYLNNMLLKV